jgi:LysR family glycine cleavage system transcriptional activator
MRRLPPLNAIKAFEAAARLMSFTKAGNELNVTYGAISRQVAQLESLLGVALFQRANSQLVLTDAGKSLFDEVAPALDRIAAAAFQLTHNEDPVTLVVNAPPTFTLRWLIPRLSTFHARHPGVSIRVTTSITSLSPIDFSQRDYNIAIRGAQQAFAGMSSRRFLTETILVVCHPDLLEKLPLAAPADLAQHTLLSYETESYGWQDWFQAVGVSDVKPLGTVRFEQMYFTLQAAKEGLGVALIPYFLVADDIAKERLCAPLGSTGARIRHYYANQAAGTKFNPAGDLFCDWLEQQGTETMELCNQMMAQSYQNRHGH